MKKSLRLRLLSMFLFNLSLALGASFFLHFVTFRPYYLLQVESHLLEISTAVEENIQEPDIQSVMEFLDETHQVDIMVADSKLETIIYSNQQPGFSQYPLENDIHHLISNHFESLEEEHLFVTLEGSPTRKVLVRKLSSGGYCILTHPLESLETAMDTMNEFHLLAGVLCCILGGVSTFFFSKKFTNPIIEISKVTKAMTKMDFHQKIDYDAPDELGQLASSINLLSEKLEENSLGLQKEISFQKVLSQNLSHELKTPISVIKGYVEALSFGIAEDKATQKEYMDVVLEECNRMNELISQMLQLSKLTSYDDSVLEQSFFSPEEFINQIKEQSRGILSQKNITLTVENQVPWGEQLWGNLDLLSQAFGNFISNALKYGDGNQIKMTISLENGGFTLSLYNSGTPLDAQETQRVFDVFYMVDKARSRDNNSHGLGLSVSQTIAQLHHGKVYAMPQENGTIFVLELPKTRELDEKGAN